MKKFSDRMGITKPIKTLQLDEVSSELRSSLWNWIFENIDRPRINYWHPTMAHLYKYHFKKPVDSVGPYPQNDLRQYLMKCPGYEVYNIIERLIHSIPDITQLQYGLDRYVENTIEELNRILEEEMSGYRIIDGHFTPICHPEEIDSIKQSLQDAEDIGFDGVKEHFKKSLEFLSQKPEPDFANSIKESISAIESFCKKITGEK
ncbi:MAG: hypothetical protein Q7T11_03310, partial [Deltaproteobacteria bacterium]|nr:hypothetical protein [Deltaproteobacteria bacterium]